MEKRKEELKKIRKALMIAANILDMKEIDEGDLEFVGEILAKMGNELLELANIIRKEKVMNIAIRN